MFHLINPLTADFAVEEDPLDYSQLNHGLFVRFYSDLSVALQVAMKNLLKRQVTKHSREDEHGTTQLCLEGFYFYETVMKLFATT